MNPEEIKRQYLGERGRWGRFSVKVDKESGFLVILSPEGKIVEVTSYTEPTY